MKANVNVFRKHTCLNCKSYSGEIAVFGKCKADKSSIYTCARLVLFNTEEFIKKTGVKDSAF